MPGCERAAGTENRHVSTAVIRQVEARIPAGVCFCPSKGVTGAHRTRVDVVNDDDVRTPGRDREGLRRREVLPGALSAITDHIYKRCCRNIRAEVSGDTYLVRSNAASKGVHIDEYAYRAAAGICECVGVSIECTGWLRWGGAYTRKSCSTPR